MSRGSSLKSRWLTMLQIVFIVAKLAGLVDWSWWWVFCPTWGSIAAVVVVCLLVGGR